MSGSTIELPPDYAPLGKITAGQEVVDLIGTQPTGRNEGPAEPIVIRSITIDG